MLSWRQLWAAERTLQLVQVGRLAQECEIAAANLHLEAGLAAEYVPRMAAQWHADIVVLGAILRGGLKRLFIGSTVERVLESLLCDVLVVRPPDFAQNLPF